MRHSHTTDSVLDPPDLLRTKLFVPRNPPELIERPELMARIIAALRRPLLLLTAPAGFGKTTTLSMALSRGDFPCAWLSLDAQDNDPHRFWAYVIGALQTLDLHIGVTALALLRSANPPPLEPLITELLNSLTTASLTNEFVLVLDDYHVIEHPVIHETLVFFITHLPPNAHLVLASRSDPPLPLPTWRVRRRITELRPEDLRFTLDETGDFVRHIAGLNLSPQDIHLLETLTEGWVAALQLAALSMQDAPDIAASLRAFGGGHRYLFDYLAQEVLEHLPEPLQDFLLRTAILDALCGPLCDAVLASHNDPPPCSGQAQLEALETANLFITPLDDERRWYRYHHLFAEFLRIRLEQMLGSEMVATLHQRAAHWYAQHGLLSAAVEHALAAQDMPQAASLISQSAELMFYRSELHTLLTWLGKLPESVVRDDPQLNLVAAWALLATAQPEAIAAHLDAVEQHLNVTAQEVVAAPEHFSPETRGILAEVLCLRSSLAFNHFELASVLELCAQARMLLTVDVTQGAFNDRASLLNVLIFNQALAYEFSGNVAGAVAAYAETLQLSLQARNLHLIPMASSHLAQLYLVQGRLREALGTYETALREAEQGPATNSPLFGLAYVGLGNVLCERNQLEQAEVYLKRGIELARRWNNPEALIPGYLGQMRIAAARGEHARRASLLDEMEAVIRQVPEHWGLPILVAQRALLDALEGDRNAARAWAAQSPFAAAAALNYFTEPEMLFLARVRLALGEPQVALVLVEQVLAHAEHGARWGRVIESLMLETVALHALGREPDALVVLGRALALAEPEGYLRTFLDWGQPMAALLKAWHSPDARLQAYVQDLRAYFDSAGYATATAVPQPLIELLSGRELEVLRLIATGCTNPEIAVQLVVSLNTVKTHAKNINAKLGARNRTEAVACARRLGLL